MNLMELKTSLANALIKIFNTSVFTKCSNNLTLCCIEHFVHRTLDKTQTIILTSKEKRKPQSDNVINSILQIGKLASEQAGKTIKHELDWTKVVKDNNVIIGAIDVVSTRSWVEGFEFEITSEIVIARILTDKSKLAIANVELQALQNRKTEQVVVFERKLNRIGIINDACRRCFFKLR
ncbi:MAG: hypothetical protein ACTS4U_01880 [Candidatus Hodgkinia cicadicola]